MPLSAYFMIFNDSIPLWAFFMEISKNVNIGMYREYKQKNKLWYENKCL